MKRGNKLSLCILWRNGIFPEKGDFFARGGAFFLNLAHDFQVLTKLRMYLAPEL